MSPKRMRDEARLLIILEDPSEFYETFSYFFSFNCLDFLKGFILEFLLVS